MEIIHISWGKVYKFGRTTFDFHWYCGPTFLRKTSLEPRGWKNISSRNWADFNKWGKLNDNEKRKYLIE